MTENDIAERAAKRLEGLREYTLYARETVYYARKIWAEDDEKARDIAYEDCEWGEAVDYANFEIYDSEDTTSS